MSQKDFLIEIIFIILLLKTKLFFKAVHNVPKLHFLPKENIYIATNYIAQISQ